jgi:hypothetical protein
MGGRRVSTQSFIVNEADIFAFNEIRAENFTFLDFAFTSNLDCIQWLTKRGLIYNSVLCGQCQVQMSLIKRAQLADGYTWKCKELQDRSKHQEEFFDSLESFDTAANFIVNVRVVPRLQPERPCT